VVTTGIVHVPQPEQALMAFRAYANGQDDFRLAALHNLTTLTGSALLAAMLAGKAVARDAAWAAAHVDEDWQIEQWGEDEEAAARRVSRWKEFEATCAFLEALE
jgi:chaperone required for assembly of F1-ATPase